jgi:WD40 repeat protein
MRCRVSFTQLILDSITVPEGKKETIHTLTCIEFSHAHSVWASSSTDGTIKIWDLEGLIIREIQFNEPLSTFCFCNEPGDLLVGLSDQITLVRVQDCK